MQTTIADHMFRLSRYEVLYRTDEDALTRAIIELASEYGRYGYRRITGGQGSSAENLAARGTESAAKTKAAREIVVQ